MTYSHIDTVFLLSDENQKSKLILQFMIIFMDWESPNEATSRVHNILGSNAIFKMCFL